MRSDLRDTFGEFPDVASYIYAGEYLRERQRPRHLPFPMALLWYRKGLWLPLSCAVAFDTSAELTLTASGTSNTTAYTVGAGSNQIMLIWTLLGAASGDILTGITVNGVAATVRQKSAEPVGSNYNYLHYILAPTTGNIVQSTSGNTLIFGAAITYNEVSQVTPTPTGLFTQGTAAPSITQTLTTTSDNCWLSGWFRESTTGTPTAGTNTTSRRSSATGGYLWGDTNAPQSPAGSYSIQALAGGANDRWIAASAALAPATAGVSVKQLAQLGVG